jgi:L-lactate utilization protein LutC
MNGASTTLEQVGYVDYLKSGSHPWNNLHEQIVKETDPAKQAVLRRQATISDYYLGSVHALTENGEIIIASNTGSQLPNVVYSSPNVLFIVGANKICKDIAEGMDRLHDHVMPLEDVRMKKVYGPNAGTYESKTLILHNEPAFNARNLRMIIIKETLGF